MVTDEILSGLVDAEIQVVSRSVELLQPPPRLEQKFDPPPPNYSHVLPEPGMDLDFAAMNIESPGLCEDCGRSKKIEKLPGYHWRETIPAFDTWNGRDIFRFGNDRSSGLYCTHRFVDLARAKKWSSFRFRPVLRPEQRDGAGLNEIPPDRKDPGRLSGCGISCERSAKTGLPDYLDHVRSGSRLRQCPRSPERRSSSGSR